MRSGNDQARRVHGRLSCGALLRPAAGSAEDRRFARWDLASLSEGALGECVDPDSLTPARERELRIRLGSHGRAQRNDDEYRRRYWIREPGGGEEDGGYGRRTPPGVVGTVAVDTWPIGAGALLVTSLYVHPVARRRGLATAVLDTVYEACRAEGLHGFRLDAHWTWQRSVRHYLNRGLWVTSWKHALGFARLSYLPRYEVRAAGDEGELTFWAAVGGEALVPMLVAGDAGGRLRLRETEESARLTEDRDAVRLRFYARSTLALHLAVRGHPLVRGEQEWAAAERWCDLGEPEGLAYRIGVFERAAREDGWRVDSPYGAARNSGAVAAAGPHDRHIVLHRYREQS
ncbi:MULTISPECIES: GNAT family N-acetyltransferase [Streptomyces]|uniref:GNAT family N-acetyltransferase n=1 Tax=Streptomyces griseiscabiei TaxID=2993540 RepID=A0ABU4KVD4_9ACTN|nr:MULTISPECIES: GNAT family N-acetyltransferase [Streptomyces]MBZ3903020.1 GNAT family N-acetyltransferase [Streptomyces griseiscabiei]MDX2907331.1 GNAT family N-acetyltransferase [Streptomyces griseiscabiei]